jgi:hypothetical protein
MAVWTTPRALASSLHGHRGAGSIVARSIGTRFMGCFAQLSASAHTSNARARASWRFADAQPLRGVTIARQAYGSPLHLLGRKLLRQGHAAAAVRTTP